MIDPHVHLRDWKQSNKETLNHGLSVAYKAGLDAVFEMPNTNPLIINREAIQRRLNDADSAGIPIFHGLYAGLTAEENQIKEIIACYNEYFPRVLGFKLFAGRSTGILSVLDEEAQNKIFRILSANNYRGVIAVHAEKEQFFKPERWNPENPETHSEARPSLAETESIKDILNFALEAGFMGTVHIAHISTKESVLYVNNFRDKYPLKVSCGVTPHHILLHSGMMKSKEGNLLKVNPPLRDEITTNDLLKLLKDEKIDWIETDHAPHLLVDKLSRDNPASGMPGFPVYPKFINFLKNQAFPDDLIERLTHGNIEKVFGFKIPKSNRAPDYSLEHEYEYNPYEKLNL